MMLCYRINILFQQQLFNFHSKFCTKHENFPFYGEFSINFNQYFFADIKFSHS